MLLVLALESKARGGSALASPVGDLFVGCGSNFRRERAKAAVVAVTKAVRDAGGVGRRIILDGM